MNSPYHSPLHSPVSQADTSEDFREALSGLKVNNRIQIETLTSIAREDTEHASSIARVIENHIKSAPHDQKLPALYVLDSITKNVGSPYDVIFGRNLFATFMEAFGRVDDRTRMSMESLLQTWSQPVPNSMNPKPVFPPTITGAINNALHQYKSSRFNSQRAQQPQTHGLPPRPPVPGSVPTPHPWGTPVNGQRFAPPPPSPYSYGGYQQPNGYPQPGGYPQQHHPPMFQPHYPPPGGYHTPIQGQQQFYPPTPQSPQHLPPPQPQRPHDFAGIHSDIESLISSIHRKRAVNPADPSLNARLKAMTDLRTLIQTTNPAPHEWDRIRDQLRLLTQQENSAPYNMHPYTQQPSTPTQYQQSPPPPFMPPPPSQQPSAPPPPPNLSQANLAQLLANLPKPPSATPQNNQPFAAPPPPASSSPLGTANTAPAPILNNNILEVLRKAGINPTPTPNGRPSSAQPVQSAYPPPPAPQAAADPTPKPPAPAQPPNDLAALLASLSQPKPASSSGPIIELTSASIKVTRLELINTRLYKAAPSQCMTCGRRFPGTREGKARKARHLDFHFRTNQRAAEAEGNGRRGVCRAWYMSEREWIKHREIDDADENAADREKAAQISGQTDGADDGAAGASGDTTQKATPYVRVPDAGAIQTSERAGQPVNMCPICQEKFENRWHGGAQEWVWMDAVRAGNRVYHASCYDEVKRDQERAEKRKVADTLTTGMKRKLEDDADGGVTKSPRHDGA